MRLFSGTISLHAPAAGIGEMTAAGMSSGAAFRFANKRQELLRQCPLVRSQDFLHCILSSWHGYCGPVSRCPFFAASSFTSASFAADLTGRKRRYRANVHEGSDLQPLSERASIGAVNDRSVGRDATGAVNRMENNGAAIREGLRLQVLLRALNSRNYRLFFAGQSVSLVGTWMQQVAMSWLVYRLTGSALLLGVVGFASQIPTFLLASVAGVLADRWNRRTILLWTQSLSMIQAVLLAGFVLTGHIQVWQVVLLSAFLGLINAFDIPVRQSFVIELVERKEDLGNAIALNSSMVNAGRLIGPSIAGMLIASVGEGVCFVINAVSYLGVIVAIAAIRVRRAPGGSAGGSAGRRLVHELREGFSYAVRFGPIRNILLLLGVVSLAGMPYSVLMPIYAKEALHGGAHTFGFLMAAAGVGAMGSTLYLASRRSVLGLGRIISAAAAALGVGVIGFALSRTIAVSVVFLCIAGFGAMAQIASSNTILQTFVDDDKRGRVMSFFTMSFMGTTPIGALLAGAAAERVGAQRTLVAGGIVCLAAAALFARNIPAMRELVRPIYERMEIIPKEGRDQD
jgi:MFS family permease